MPTRKSAVQDFVRLIYSKTIEEFGQIWSEYSDNYRQHEVWLRYTKVNWLKHLERWWGGNRGVSSNFHQIIENVINI